MLKQKFNINQKVNDLNIKTKLIRDVIEVYNHIRPHVSHILTPKQMRQQRKLKSKQYKTKILREVSFSEN
ncbi:hypothetical protein [uncultured Maribacter sp.]|uniref:hypothetical protein n=1 Tax=uncultured Maribacter sp. TaxID=431308 RepID=UPI003440709C